MKNLVLVLLAVLFLGLPGGVKAEDVVEPVVDTVEVSVPDVESGWFGLRWAFVKVSHNVQVVLARTDEKKDELEMKFAEKEEVLIARITALEESNPKLAEKLSGKLDKISEKYEERVDKLGVKMNKLEEREQEMKTRMEQWMERREENKQKLEQKKEEIRERVESRGTGNDGNEDEDEDESGQTLKGGSVRIENARPGVIRLR
jgi:hypothetical protein